jgi:(1->4)-alpha-D-glucan 1-alpha-D-glucosylmutase
MLKAIREAKLHTSWNRPDAAYESAVRAHVQALLGDGRSAPLAYLRPRVAALAWFGALNSLSATVLKLTVPGVPDTYQGTELFDFSLVDPDNRRPVDWARREALLAQFEALDARADADAIGAAVAEMRDALARGDDGRLKLWLIRRLLHARRADPALYADGGYTALPVLGPRRTGAVAFMRRHAGRTLLVIAGRKFASAGLDPQAPWDGSPWAGTRIAWPAALKGDARGRDLISGAPPPPPGDAIDIGHALRTLPVAVWAFGEAGV